MDHKVTTDYTRLLGNANVKVFVRARPCADGQEPPEDMFERKRETPKNIVIKDTERMQYGNHAFSFDNIYWTDTTQAEFFEASSKHLVDYALKGINSCCFAYGQTGSGKTFSIFGESGEKAGCLPRAIECLFERIERHENKSKEFTLVVSFLEIYCDRVRDLSRDYLKKTSRPISYQTSSPTEWFLRQQQMQRIESSSSFSSASVGRPDEEYDYEKANFEIHEDAQGRVFVKDLAMVTVTSREEVDAIIQSGLKLRATYETKMNAVSSRSHTVFTIHVFQQIRETEEIIYGMLNMVDLAGSERLKKSESDGQRLKEALHINSSLSAVGKVVMSLDPESGYNYIPYRDSKLTRLLQNSIGGNCMTLLIATIHPMKEHYEECLSTFQFANRCRSVQNQPRVNHINGSVADKDKRIRKLQEELSLLRRQMEGLRTEYNHRFVATLKELGFDAEEITENGELKFADGLVLPSVFGDKNGDQGVIAALSPSARRKNDEATGLSAIKSSEMSKKDRDQLRQKYANAKNNFAVLATESRKEKEDSRKVISDQRRKIITLESALAQKTREFERALASEEAKHKAEIAVILSHNQQIQDHDNGRRLAHHQTHKQEVESSRKQDEQLQQKFLQRVAVMESTKNGEVALIRQQFAQALEKKQQDVDSLKANLQLQQATSSRMLENLRDDCLALHAYVSRLCSTIECQQRNQPYTIPKNVLADPNKLRHIKALIAMDPKRNFDLGAPADTSQSEVKLARPVSAPLRRPKSNNYPSMLRDRIRETASTSSLPDTDVVQHELSISSAREAGPWAARPPQHFTGMVESSSGQALAKDSKPGTRQNKIGIKPQRRATFGNR